MDEVCEWCTGKRVRISDYLIVPCDLAEAKRHWKDCVISQTNTWAFCSVLTKGRIGGEPMKMLALEKRAGLE